MKQVQGSSPASSSSTHIPVAAWGAVCVCVCVCVLCVCGNTEKAKKKGPCVKKFTENMAQKLKKFNNNEIDIKILVVAALLWTILYHLNTFVNFNLNRTYFDGL